MTDDQQVTNPEPPSAPEADGGFNADFEAYANDETPADPQEASPPAEGNEEPVQGDGEEEPHPPEEDADIWESASDAQKAAIKAAEKKASDLEHQFSSTHGRQLAYQRRVSDLEKQLASNKDAGKKVTKEEEDKELESLRDEFPDFAGPVEKLMQGKDARIMALEEKDAERDVERQNADLDKQLETLAIAHPDWQPLTASCEFEQWVYEQPPYVGEAFQRNAVNVVDGNEAAHLLTQFKASLSKSEPPPEEGPEEESEEGKENNISGKRERQLKTGASAQGKGPGAGSGPPDDFDKAFKHYAEKD
ncbi:MAG: hypothetical protein GY835_09335 [bacterium]|nr:hypothetical protein [bacterium]